MPPESSRLAIDLSGGVIRVLDGSMGGPMRCGTGAMPDGAWAGGRVVDPLAVGNALKQLLARTEIVTTRALVAVSDAVATFRVIELDPTATDQQVGAAVARELAFDPERFVSRWTQVGASEHRRVIYAAAWDRAIVQSAAEAVKLAGAEPVVIELKSAALARTVAEPSCIILDLVSEPAEIVLVDGHMPHMWHSSALTTSSADELPEALATPIRSVIRFHRRKSGTTFGPESPVLVSAEQLLPAQLLVELSGVLGQPVQLLPSPPRVPENVRHSVYLTCLGLIMRREA